MTPKHYWTSIVVRISEHFMQLDGETVQVPYM